MNRRMRSHSSRAGLRQRGIALITAIFVVALAVIAGVAMFEASNLAAHRTANLVTTEAAWWYADGIEAWVKTILQKDKQLNNTDSFADIWAVPEVVLPIENGSIRGHIEDLQGRFNINNLGTTDVAGAAIYLAQFQRLIDNLPDFDASHSTGVGDAIRDWVDADSNRTGYSGAEDSDYLGGTPPYRAANAPMASVSELLMVKGMTKELYAALKPYVAALPTTKAMINVNTAPEPVLLSLGVTIDRSKLQRFIAARKELPLKNPGDLFGTGDYAFMINGATNLRAGDLTTSTNYFLLQSEVLVGSGRVALYSVFLRNGSGAPIVIAHSTDTD